MKSTTLHATLGIMVWFLGFGETAITQSNAKNQNGFPIVSSKKGLQVQMVADALELGIKHAAINMDLTSIIAPQGGPESIEWVRGPRRFHFNRRAVEALDHQIKPLSDRGVLVYLILLAYASGDPERDELTLHPDYDKNAPNKLGAFNTSTGKGEEWLSGSADFLSARWSGADNSHGRVAGYIVGNEVNSHWWWANMGRVSLEKFTDEYLKAVRLIHSSIRQHSNWARVYISMEHHWSIRYPAGTETQSFPGRSFLDQFAAKARSTGDFDWHLAFHPYPENLFEPRFWKDRSATPEFESPRITFKNLEVLSRYMQQPSMTFNGQLRSIILSEQGFNTPDGENGEAVQAAAFCLAYKKVESIDSIHAFILHRHVDHAQEGGLRLGLWSNKSGTLSEPARKKLIYECFKQADTTNWKSTFEFALPITGLRQW